MKVLLINQTFYPDVTATGQYLTDLALELVRRGHEVTALTAARGYTAPYPRFPGKENYQEIRIVRVWPFMLGRRNRFLRIIDSVCVNAAFAVKLLGFPKFDRVLALTSPPLIGWVASLFARWKNSKFIYWLMDINPDEAIEAGWINPKSIQACFLNTAMIQTLKYSNKIICLDTYMKKRVEAKGAKSEDVCVMPPWSHDEALESVPHEINPFRKQHGLENQFVVMYAGNHSICHPLDTLLEAAVLLKAEDAIRFVFIGGGERVKDVNDYQMRHNLTNVIRLPYLNPYQSASNLKFALSAADLHVVVMGNHYVGIVHPCKIYGILAVGRPFVYIGPQKSHVTEIMGNDKIGYEVPHCQQKKLPEVIKSAISLTPVERQDIAGKEKRAAQRFSQHYLCAELANLITESG